jgi:hypothetical protein
MLDIPTELLLIISTYLDYPDLRSLAITSRFICRSLLPEYLCRRGFVLKDGYAGGSIVELRDLTAYASLGLWSAVHIFYPSTQEARSAIGFLIRFLLEPSNTHNLHDFQLSLRGSNSLLLVPEFCKMQRLFYDLPLTELCFSGFSSVDYLPTSTALRSSPPSGSRTLTSLLISSNYAFTPGLKDTTMGILRHSPIETLMVYMESWTASQWSTFLGGLNMACLEDIELEGDIPQPALIRFLCKHRGLKSVRIRGNAAPSDHLQPSRSWQPFLPKLLTLCVPLAVCCGILERISDSSSLYQLEVEMSRLHPHDPAFRRLLEILQHFQKLDHLKLRLVWSSPSATPEPNDWDGHPLAAHELKQIRILSFFRSQGQFLPGDIVGPHLLSSRISCLTQSDRTCCAPMFDYFQPLKRSMQ